MLYMGLKEWKKALLFLEIVMTSPVTNNASKIQVEAYKKWVLVSLLYKGSVSCINLRTSYGPLFTIYRSFRLCPKQ